MRHDQADEADRPGRRDRGAGGDRRGEQVGAAAPADRHAEGRRPGVAARQPVELARARPDDGERERQRDPDDLPMRGAVQVAEQPEHHAAQLALVGEPEDQRDDRRAARADHHADQQQRRRAVPARRRRRAGEAAARAGRTAAPRRGRRRPPHRRRCAIPRAAAARRRREHGAERADRGTAGDAEHVRVGERIARQQLHQRAGRRERGAGAEAGEHARHPDLPEDLRRRGADAGRAGEHAEPARGRPRRRRGRSGARAWARSRSPPRAHRPWPSKRTPSHAWRPRPW